VHLCGLLCRSCNEKINNNKIVEVVLLEMHIFIKTNKDINLIFIIVYYIYKNYNKRTQFVDIFTQI